MYLRYLALKRIFFSGDLLSDDGRDTRDILKWMLAELKEKDIKEVTVKVLLKLIEKGKSMAAIFYQV